MLQGKSITVHFGSSAVVNNLSFTLEEGQWLMLAGPNGAGKSTLIEAIAQGVNYAGSILWNGQDIRGLKPAQLAQRIGVLSQKNTVGYAYTVEEIVSLGRYAHRSGLFSARDDEGKGYVEKALKLTGMSELRHASMLTLSGGEMQRAFLAQVFAQDPQVLILDEPGNHLDLKYQQHIFSLIQEWLKEPGRAVLSVVHDLSLARAYGTQALLLYEKHVLAQGSIDHVFDPAYLNTAYGMDVAAWMRTMLGQWT